MSVQIIENWSDIRGTIREIRPSPAGEAFFEITIVVDTVSETDGFPSLVLFHPGETIPVQGRKDTPGFERISNGAKISGRIRMAGSGRYFFHPELVRILEPD
jgi:hypothetical protein